MAGAKLGHGNRRALIYLLTILPGCYETAATAFQMVFQLAGMGSVALVSL